MPVFYISLNFLREQETKQQRLDKKGAKGDMMEVKKTLAEREMVSNQYHESTGI